jgi:hypothetical protein
MCFLTVISASKLKTILGEEVADTVKGHEQNGEFHMVFFNVTTVLFFLFYFFRFYLFGKGRGLNLGYSTGISCGELQYKDEMSEYLTGIPPLILVGTPLILSPLLLTLILVVTVFVAYAPTSVSSSNLLIC